MRRVDRVAAVTALAAVTMLGVTGCGTRQAVKTVIEQGVETTSAGTYNTVPANNADKAVQGINDAVQQTQQDAQGAGQ